MDPLLTQEILTIEYIFFLQSTYYYTNNVLGTGSAIRGCVYSIIVCIGTVCFFR